MGGKFLQHLFVVLAEDYFLPPIFWQFMGCKFGYFFPFFFLFTPILQYFMEMVPITLTGCF